MRTYFVTFIAVPRTHHYAVYDDMGFTIVAQNKSLKSLVMLHCSYARRVKCHIRSLAVLLGSVAQKSSWSVVLMIFDI